jgi:hypothetical protein
MTPDLVALVEEKLTQEQWSPDQISGASLVSVTSASISMCGKTRRTGVLPHALGIMANGYSLATAFRLRSLEIRPRGLSMQDESLSPG